MLVKGKNCKVLANIYLTSIVNKTIKMQNLTNRTSSNAINTQVVANTQIVVDT